jgi:hypothetical protein
METLEERQFLSADHAGNTLAKAHNIGTLTGAQFNDYVGVGDTVDYYKFKVSGLKDVRVDLIGQSPKVRLAIIRDFNKNGTVESSEILDNQGGRSTSRTSDIVLGSGTYFARVMQTKAKNKYLIMLGASAVDPGNTLHTAFNAGTLAGSTSFTQQVGGSDPIDYYKFTFTTTRHLILQLKNMSGDLDLQLIRDVNGNGLVDDPGDIIDTSETPGIADEQIIFHTPPGTYYIAVIPADDSVSSNYSLILNISDQPA